MTLNYKTRFFYPSGSRLTGQELASRLILELLGDDVKLSFRIVKLPVFNRERIWSALYWLQFFVSIVYACYQMLITGVNRNIIVYLNLGQSMKSLLLEGASFGLAGIFNSGRRSVISLHGHLFVEWSLTCVKAKLLQWILARSSKVTVLGLSQKEKLIGMGIEREKIQIVNNTCEGILERLVGRRKLSMTSNLLYFGNLIEAKGYRKYLIALLLLSEMKIDKRVHAVICGQFTKASLDRRGTSRHPETWINEIIDRINQSSNVHVSWTPGAYDTEKAKVFGDADILIFPSYYRVEAQPIVLIEAMAASCAIISTAVGEIPTMLTGGVGICLEDCTPENLANSIYELLNNSKLLKGKQASSRMRFESQYGRDIYANTWNNIFKELGKHTEN